MLQLFIQQTKDFLLKSDIMIHRLKRSEVNLIENGGLEYFMELSDEYRQAGIANNVLLHTMVFFTLADALIDANKPELVGRSFLLRYRRLPACNDNDVIFKECYRILKIIRNSATHNRRSLIMEDNILTVKYSFQGTDFRLVISHYGLELIYTFLLGEYVPNGYSKEYEDGVARKLYDEIDKEVQNLNDETGKMLKCISDRPRLTRNRYSIRNTQFQQNNDEMKVLTDIRNTNIPMNVGVDFLIQHNNKEFSVPKEILNIDNSISIQEMSKWYSVQ